MGNSRVFAVLMVAVVLLGSVLFSVEAAAQDWRNILNGNEIPSENYAEMPYITVTQDGNWLCVLTTGPGGENAVAQHVIASVSTDQGENWSEPIDIEPSVEDPKTSWATSLVVPSGRVYAFYNVAGVDFRIRQFCRPDAREDIFLLYADLYFDIGRP